VAFQRSPYSPPPHRRSSNIVKRDFHRRLRGKPTYSSSLLSLPRVMSLVFGKVIVLSIIVLIIVGFLFAGLGSGMLIGYITTASPVATEQLKNKNETTRIIDSAGNEIAILTGSQNINREYVSISAVKSTWIDEAVKAIEDERFDVHIGIDPKRIGSAILSALVNRGSATHGGSTITQQTVKMVSGANELSAQRKVQEWYRAVRLEQDKSKDEIMELYLNLVPMGNSYVGIQSASKAYFDKNASELNLVECAFLAGIPNRPSTYNPLTETGRRNALRRMRIVLGKMNELGMITEKQYLEALNTELVFRKRPMTVSATQVNSYFVDYVIAKVIDDLVEKRGYSEQMASVAVYNYGLQIETTVDSSIQAKVEQTFNTQSLFSTNPEELVDLPEKPNGSIVVIENTPNPGQIKAIVGGYGEKTGNFVLNRAISARRQPGSSIKPLDVYGPALDTGKISASTVFTDTKLFLNKDEPTKPYPKNNYTKPAYKGNMTVRSAIRVSCNTIAAYVWQYVLKGETSLYYLKQVGIDRSTENYVAIALGAFNKGMTALEMAGAYATFANNGLYTEPYAYTRVLDADGEVLLENVPEFTQVYKPETAYVMTSILKDVLKTGGTASGYGIKGMPAAGKTGTTDEMRDKWFCGYTPYYTAVVWYGYDNRLGQTKIPTPDRSNAVRIWQDAMIRIHDGLEPIDFVMPKTVVKMKICTVSGMLATELCPMESVITEYFVPGALMNPTATCTVHTALPTPTPTIAPTMAEPTLP
jgi:penicillin-binding protein 1A